MKRTAPRDAALPADQTRAALTKAALLLFGRKGFDATTTREIAALAGSNVGSIAYHFGGKDGLREACASFVADTLATIAAEAVKGLPIEQGLSQTAAEAMLVAALRRMIEFVVVRPEAGEIVQFMLREAGQPSSAFDIVYSRVFEPVHKRFCGLWSIATGGDPESDHTRIAVFTLVGQVLYFRVGQPAILRRMGWDAIGPEQADAVGAVVAANIHAAIAAARKSG